MSADLHKKLDTYFMNLGTTNFMKNFFGQDKILVKNALKAVLPDSVSDEALTTAADALSTYKPTLKKTRDTDVDIFFRELYDK